MKKILVKRERGRTVVTYMNEPVARAIATPVPVMKQKPVPVYLLGEFQHYILADGRIFRPRMPILKRITRVLTAWSIMLTIGWVLQSAAIA